jgi:hypothetical protein
MFLAVLSGVSIIGIKGSGTKDVDCPKLSVNLFRKDLKFLTPLNLLLKAY